MLKCVSTFLLMGLLALGVSSSALLQADDSIAVPDDPRQFHLFILAGQSNMAGRGEVSDEDRTPVPRVLMFSKDQQWVPAVDPLHFDKPDVVGTGLGKTFASELAADDPDVVIGLIPCAVGGSPIATWQPGAIHADTNTPPWDDCIEQVNAAAPSGTIKGILWHQGEADCHPERADVYEEKLGDLIERMRSEFEVEDVPFLIGQLGQFDTERFPRDENWEMVNAAHQRIAETTPNVLFISSDGLTDRDGIHFDSASYRTLGKRYAEAYRQWRRGQQP